MSVNEESFAIINFAMKVRVCLERCRDKRFGYFSNFPTGCCEGASILLGKKISLEFGLESCVVGGKFQLRGVSYTHAWLRFMEFDVDLTADQFGPENSPVSCFREHCLSNGLQDVSRISSVEYDAIIEASPVLSAVWFELSRI